MSSLPTSPGIIYLGLDVHKDSVTIAVLPAGATAPTRIDKYPYDFAKLRRVFERHAKDGEIRACYEASDAGYVLQRAMQGWGYHCDVIAPSLIPTKPGVQRKHDRYDAAHLARLYRAGELTTIRIPSEAEERVRDVVRCRETLQREVVKSRHYILKFLARRGFIYRGGVNWRPAHYNWLRQLTGVTSPLAPEDRLVVGEYFALLEYKRSRRDILDHHMGALALTPASAPAVATRHCFRGRLVHSAMVLAQGARRLAAVCVAAPTDGASRRCAARPRRTLRDEVSAHGGPRSAVQQHAESEEATTLVRRRAVAMLARLLRIFETHKSNYSSARPLSHLLNWGWIVG